MKILEEEMIGGYQSTGRVKFGATSKEHRDLFTMSRKYFRVEADLDSRRDITGLVDTLFGQLTSDGKVFELTKIELSHLLENTKQFKTATIETQVGDS